MCKNGIPKPNIFNDKMKYYKQNESNQKKVVRPKSAYNKKTKVEVEQNPQIIQFNEQKESMFDNYYKEKMLKQYNDIYYNDSKITSNEKEENIYNINDNNQINRPQTSKIRKYNNKNYDMDNKNIIANIQKANCSKMFEQNNNGVNPYHKEYGKIPKYIKNMREEAEKKKEIEKIRKETSKYPKGTRLLSEEERLFTLEKLKQSKNDINQIIEKLPITCDTQSFKNKKEELFRKLDEIENAIETFSKAKVFVKIE